MVSTYFMLFSMFCPRVSDPAGLLAFGISSPHLSIATYHSKGLETWSRVADPHKDTTVCQRLCLAVKCSDSFSWYGALWTQFCFETRSVEDRLWRKIEGETIDTQPMGSVQYKMVLLFCMFCPRVSDPSNLLTFGRSRPYLSIAPYHSTRLET